jgi:hypothetical protein
MARPSGDHRFLKARRLLDLIGESDAASLRRSIWKQFKESQARTVAKEDAALLRDSMDVAPLRNAFTHLWARESTEEGLDAAIAFFVSPPGREYLAAAEGFPGPYWKSLLHAPESEAPSFLKARRIVEAAGAFDRCRQALGRKAAEAKAETDPDEVRDAAARQYLKVLGDRSLNTALVFFESKAGGQLDRAVRAQAAEGPGLFRLWLTDWVTETARRKVSAASGPGYTDKRRGFSLAPPEGWTAKARGSGAAFRDGTVPPQDENAPTLTVLSEAGGDFPGFLASEEAGLEGSLKDFILRFREEAKIGGRPALLLTYLYKKKDAGSPTSFKALTLLVDGGKRFWTLTCASRSGDFDRIKGPCRQAMFSFKAL